MQAETPPTYDLLKRHFKSSREAEYKKAEKEEEDESVSESDVVTFVSCRPSSSSLSPPTVFSSSSALSPPTALSSSTSSSPFSPSSSLSALSSSSSSSSFLLLPKGEKGQMADTTATTEREERFQYMVFRQAQEHDKRTEQMSQTMLNNKEFKKKFGDVVDWMIGTANTLQLEAETFCDSVYLMLNCCCIDESLLKQNVLLGLVCLMIECKNLDNITDDNAVSVWVGAGRQLFSAAEILEMERTILCSTVAFDVQVTSPLNLVYALRKVQQRKHSAKQKRMSMYLCCTVLLHAKILLRYSALDLALAILDIVEGRRTERENEVRQIKKAETKRVKEDKWETTFMLFSCVENLSVSLLEWTAGEEEEETEEDEKEPARKKRRVELVEEED